MHTTRQELLSSATGGRGGHGFGVAYYFDTEIGDARRTRLRELLQRTARNLDSVLSSEVGDPPPVFHRVMRGLRNGGPASGAPESVRVAAQ